MSWPAEEASESARWRCSTAAREVAALEFAAPHGGLHQRIVRSQIFRASPALRGMGRRTAACPQPVLRRPAIASRAEERHFARRGRIKIDEVRQCGSCLVKRNIRERLVRSCQDAVIGGAGVRDYLDIALGHVASGAVVGRLPVQARLAAESCSFDWCGTPRHLRAKYAGASAACGCT